MSTATPTVPRMLRQLSRHFRVTSSRGFSLARFRPDDTRGLALKDNADGLLDQSRAVMADLQERLFAQDRWSVLLIFQAMDAAGKDGTIKHVMSGLNPRGCEVHSFKAPSSTELDHDYLWRTTVALPRRGHIGIFNRSYYEEALVVRVHPKILDRQQLPAPLVTRNIWRERFEDIRHYERYLTRQGVIIRKFFLYVSKEEQRQRFLERLTDPDKRWKFALGDLKEREHFDDYLRAYGDAIANTATPYAPWYVVPADKKWFTRLVVASTVMDALEAARPSFPVVDEAARRALDAARRTLQRERPSGRPSGRPRSARRG